MKKFRTLLIITALSFFSCSDNTVETVSQPEQELLRQLSDSVNTVVNKMFNSLATFADSTAKEKTINETKIRTMFTKWCLDFPEVVDCAFVTPLGIMQYIEPAAYQNHEGADISAQAHVIQMWQTKKPVLSLLFMSVEGFYACDMEVPFYFDSALGGSYSMLVKPEIFFNKILRPVIKSDIDDIFVMQKDGTMLWDSDTTQIGRNTFTDTLYQQFPELISAAHKVAQGEKGNTNYSFFDNSKSKVVTKTVWWSTLNYYGTEWKLCIVKEAK
ncbi:MAG: hypothetical protein GX452_05635 [Ignavibacteriales bacterium]|jgi:hypothetical protein|nr:hypothetical protein [Ignavibacteriales bacterium]HOJ18776.1 hypothetical protein [Ignavibacteriaceae bacterium]HPO55999.1 hypothetical protein [Ignavibacteriaceae bacterium]